MPASLFSPLWYRVEALHPRLRPQVSVQRRIYRGEAWYLLVDAVTGRRHRVAQAAYRIIGRCDGSLTVNALWETVQGELGEAAPTQDEIVQLLVLLHEKELLQFEITPDVELLLARPDGRRRRFDINPLAFRVALFDPARLLDRLAPLLRWAFHPVALGLWAVIVLGGALAALVHWDALRAHAETHLATPRYLLLAWLGFPILKLLHELAHGASVRHWGGQVHEMGMTLLFLTPAPYVDASAAGDFRERRRRIAVGAAGVVVELVVAAAALFVWLNVEPGLLADTAFVLMLLGAASTLLVNANPLLRFDGYHVLCDALELPNLAQRSRAYWIWIVQRHVLRVREAAVPETAPGEAKWLLLYAPLSWVYRLALAAAAVLWLGGKSWLLGALTALLVFIALCIKPARALLRALLANLPAHRAGHARLAAAAIALGVLAALGLLPLPHTTVAQGIVWLPEQAQVRLETGGFIGKLPARDGQRIEPGDLLVVLDDPTLAVSREKLQSRLLGLQAEQYLALLREPTRAQDLGAEIAAVEAELDGIEERIRHLEVRAQTGGRLVMPRQDDLAGTFARQGTTLGYVLDDGSIRVRAAVAEADAGLVRGHTRAIEVRLAEAGTSPLPARLEREVPAATYLLPGAALGDRAGGRHPTDPADPDGTRSLEPVFLFDVAVPSKAIERVGGRVWVRFDHGTAPLASQWYRRASQLLLQHFDPT